MPALFDAGPGLAWSESLLAVPLTAIVPAIDTPSPARLNADICTFTTLCRPATAEVRDAVKERIQPLSSCL